MPLRYAVPFPHTVRETFDRSRPDTKNRRGQWHELVQHLTDLAYLSLNNFKQWHALRLRDQVPSGSLLDAVLRAVGTFVAEDDYEGFTRLESFPGRGRRERLAWVEQHLSLVIYRLVRYVSFDGELEVKIGYRVGERSCFGRSLAFRIRVYFHNFIDRRTSKRKDYFDRDLLKYIYSLDNSLQGLFRQHLSVDDAIHGDVQRLLLDWQYLFDLFRRVNRFNPWQKGPYYLIYDTQDEAMEPFLEIPVTEREERRMLRLRRRAERRIGNHPVHIDTGLNRLGVRMIQLGLWRAGLYTGILDGDFGAMSHRAIVTLIIQELERNKTVANPTLSNRELQRVLFSVRNEEDSLWILDLRLIGKLLDAYAPPSEEIARREEESVWSAIRSAGKEAEIDATFTERQAEINEFYGDLRRHPERRVYYGIRGLIRGAFRAIGRILDWIVRKVKNILGAIFDFVKATVKRIQEGIALFFEGFVYFGHYLLGKPFVTLGSTVEGKRPVLLTRFRVDFDSVALVDTGASPDDLRTHAEYLNRVGRGIDYFLDTTVTIIQLIARLKPPLGWIWLGIVIARGIRDLLRRALRPVREPTGIYA